MFRFFGGSTRMRPSTDKASSHTSRGNDMTFRTAAASSAIFRSATFRSATFGRASFKCHARLAGALALVLLNILVLPWLGTAAHAQGAVRSSHGDWQIRCDTPPGAQSEQCALIQSVVAEDRSNAGLTVIMLKTADQKSRLMRVVAPLGVLLPSGLGLTPDNQDVGRAGFVRCLPNGCVAEVVMDDKLLGQLRTAKTCLLYTSDAADDLLCVDLGGRRIIKKKK